MVEAIYINENPPYPNNSLPLLFYENVLAELLVENYTDQDVKELFAKNGYSQSWTNGIYSYHHFHSNVHEVLACVDGEAKVQLGGPGSRIFHIKKGDVVLLPAGLAHKKIESSQDFSVVGAYPNAIEYNMRYGKIEEYKEVKDEVEATELPDLDPIYGGKDGLIDYWK